MNKYCIANWKMYMNKSKINSYFSEFLDKDFKSACNIVICPSTIHLGYVNDIIKSNEHIKLGAQNVSEFESGAYTGEHSLEMLNEYNCKYSIIGHSERRQLYGETDLNINNKLRLLNNVCDLKAIQKGNSFGHNFLCLLLNDKMKAFDYFFS